MLPQIAAIVLVCCFVFVAAWLKTPEWATHSHTPRCASLKPPKPRVGISNLKLAAQLWSLPPIDLAIEQYSQQLFAFHEFCFLVKLSDRDGIVEPQFIGQPRDSAFYEDGYKRGVFNQRKHLGMVLVRFSELFDLDLFAGFFGGVVVRWEEYSEWVHTERNDTLDFVVHMRNLGGFEGMYIDASARQLVGYPQSRDVIQYYNETFRAPSIAYFLNTAVHELGYRRAARSLFATNGTGCDVKNLDTPSQLAEWPGCPDAQVIAYVGQRGITTEYDWHLYGGRNEQLDYVHFLSHLRLTPELETRAAAWSQANGLSGRYLSVHWRRGDRRHFEVGNHEYWERSAPGKVGARVSEILAARPELSAVFVATNSGSAEDRKALADSVRVPVVYYTDHADWRDEPKRFYSELWIAANADVYLAVGATGFESSPSGIIYWWRQSIGHTLLSTYFMDTPKQIN